MSLSFTTKTAWDMSLRDSSPVLGLPYRSQNPLTSETSRNNRLNSDH